MADEQTPVDDAVVVQDPVEVEEKITEELVEKVTKLVDPEETPDEKSEEPGVEPEATADEGEVEKEEVAEISEQLQSRAKGLGLTDDLAQRLHQSGQLEETLAAFDRRMIDHVQSKQEPAKDEGQRETQPPPKDQDVPALDPETYDEAIVKRDEYQTKRIDALEAKLEEVLAERQSGFDEWFDGVLTELGVDTNDNDKCQSVFKAYGAICEAFGTEPGARDRAMAERAYGAMYPQDVFKQKQQKTVDRLRDAQGKFLSKSPAKGGPPPKEATEEEVNEQLLSNVTAYLKEQGVQMSGY
jgi:hypothetical protein